MKKSGEITLEPKVYNLLDQIYSRIDNSKWTQADADDLIDDWVYNGEINSKIANYLKKYIKEYINDK